MGSYTLIETPDGERQFVLASAEYGADITIIAENIDLPDDSEAELVDGAWTVPLDILKRRKCDEVNAYLAGQFLGGFTPSSGPLTGHTLQTRDNTDRTNWLTSQDAYSAQIAAGNGTVVGASFRTADNETISCSFQEGLDTLLAMAAWGSQLYAKSWALKDAINALTTAGDVIAYDVPAEWGALQ
jgi:hypothetical protein